MRKILLLTTVFTLSFSVIAKNNEAHALLPFALEATLEKVTKEATLKELLEASKKHFAKIYEELRKQSEQNTTVQASGQAYSAAVATGVSQSTAQTAQQELGAAAVINNSGIAENNCSLQVTAAGSGKAAGNANDVFQSSMAADMADINNEPGTTFENGVTDGNVRIYNEQTSTLSGNEHLSMAKLFDPSITPEDQKAIKYIKIMTKGNTTLKLPKNLVDNPDTDTKNIIVNSDRLKIINSVSLTIMNDVISKNTAQTTSSKSAKYLNDILKEAKFLPEEFRNELINGNKISYMGGLEALALAHMNPNYFKEKGFAGSIKAYLSSMVFLKGFNNLIQIEQLKIAQKNAVASGLSVLLASDPLRRDLNRRIAAKRAGR